jgi:transposase
MAKKGQKFKTINEDLILKIVKEKIDKGKSYSYLSKKYNVSEGSIATWVRKYNYKGYVNREKKGVKKSPSKMTIEELRIENEILKKFQAFLKQQHDKK